MARIRSVHPALFTDEAFVSVSPIARILWIGLWTDADDGGVFEWKPLQIKMRLLPGDHADVVALLDELAAAGLVRGFSQDGKMYGAIKDFQKYQRPQKPRATFPLPEDLIGFVTGLGEPEPDLFADQSRTSTRKVNQMERRGEEDGIGGETRARRKPETTIPEGFPDSEAISKGEQMVTEGAVTLDVSRQATRFRNHAEQHDRRCRDWRAAWRNWMDKAIETAPRLLHPPAPVSAEEDAARKLQIDRTRMQDWLTNPESWDRSVRGPTPDEDGCRISGAVMAEFRYVPRKAVPQ